MKINENCLPCLVNQVIKVANLVKVEDKEKLYHDVFQYLSTLDFCKTNPEIIGSTFALVKKHTGNQDPYHSIRNYYNTLFLEMLPAFEERIQQATNPLEEAIKYAIVGNIIDFNPIHNSCMEDIMHWFDHMDQHVLARNDLEQLQKEITTGRQLLYLGDNCGEICLDKLLIKKLKELNPNLTIYFGVRGTPVVNDSIEEDAYNVGLDSYATIISNGDDSLGTVLERTSDEFQHIFHNSDIIIAKGQANYESLSEISDANIYYLLMTKCETIANSIGVEVKSLVCLHSV